MVWVLGATSLVEGSPNDIHNSRHIGMWETDTEIELDEVIEEFNRISRIYYTDYFIFKTRRNKSRWHVISFDVLRARTWDAINASVALPTDYPQIWERTYDRFMTLRVSSKGKFDPPRFVTGIWNPMNIYQKSSRHIKLYGKLGLLVPSHYIDLLYESSQPLYFTVYNAHHI